MICHKIFIILFLKQFSFRNRISVFDLHTEAKTYELQITETESQLE